MPRIFQGVRADHLRKLKTAVRKTGAVVYCRVSTKEQQSIPVQEAKCREYCTANGWEVVRVFQEKESATTTNRTEFQEMLEFCGVNRNSIAAVVFYDTTRFSRETSDYHAVKAFLKLKGIDVRAATQPFDDSPAGELTESVLVAYGTFDNRMRMFKTIEGMKANQRQGRWNHQAPIGYRIVSDAPADQPNLAQDVQRAPLVKQAFELYASGAPSKAGILQRVTQLGLKGKSGRPLSQQTFDKMLRSPLYAGWLTSRWGITVRGKFEPIISDDVFERVQDRLIGKNPGTRQTRSAENPDFPLRVFVRCAACGKGITGSFSTGRRGKRYAYYCCRLKGCRAVKFGRDKLHHEFHQLLYHLHPEEGFMPLFRAVVRDVWKQKHVDHEQRLQQGKQVIGALEKKNQQIVDAFLEGTFDRPTYEAQRERVGTALKEARVQQSEALISADQVECLLEFAHWMLEQVAGIWNSASLPNQRRIQEAFFPEGLTVTKEGFGTPLRPLFFKQFHLIPVEETSLASPRGFEPLLSP